MQPNLLLHAICYKDSHVCECNQHLRCRILENMQSQLYETHVTEKNTMNRRKKRLKTTTFIVPYDKDSPHFIARAGTEYENL